MSASRARRPGKSINFGGGWTFFFVGGRELFPSLRARGAVADDKGEVLLGESWIVWGFWGLRARGAGAGVVMIGEVDVRRVRWFVDGWLRLGWSGGFEGFDWYRIRNSVLEGDDCSWVFYMNFISLSLLSLVRLVLI